MNNEDEDHLQDWIKLEARLDEKHLWASTRLVWVRGKDKVKWFNALEGDTLVDE